MKWNLKPAQVRASVNELTDHTHTLNRQHYLIVSFGFACFLLPLAHTLYHWFTRMHVPVHRHIFTKAVHGARTARREQTQTDMNCNSLECLCEEPHCEIQPPTITSDTHKHTRKHMWGPPPHCITAGWMRHNCLPSSVQFHPNLSSLEARAPRQLLKCFQRVKENERCTIHWLIPLISMSSPRLSSCVLISFNWEADSVRVSKKIYIYLCHTRCR